MRTRQCVVVLGFLSMVVASVFASEMQTEILFKAEVIDTTIQLPKAIPAASLLTDRKIYLVIQFRDNIQEKMKLI